MVPFPVLLALLVQPIALASHSHRLNGHAGWTTSATSPVCPCANASLCKPVARSNAHEDVYAFHTVGAKDWKQYDWSQITTVCVFGALDPEMLCHAHANGARVTFGSGGLSKDDWHNESKVDAYVHSSVAKVQAAFADGFNIDIEIGASAKADIDALTALSTKAAAAMHAANPHSHVTYDVPAAGLLEEGGCGKQYGRDYDFKGLAEALDFLVVMDYDSNDYSRSCPTCFLANAALPVVKAGVECYKSLGVRASKLVLAFPWYGYDYTCSAGDKPGACIVKKASQIGQPQAQALLANSTRQWEEHSSTPFFFYVDNGIKHRVDYDDSQSLKLKYAYAKEAGALGVGMWTASSLNYSDTETVTQFWEDLKTFQATRPRAFVV